MHLKPGQRLRWEPVSETEVRVVVEAAEPDAPDPMAALGFGARHRKGVPKRTADWMAELRAGE
nr:hypothetical protein [Coraliomargarita parva]